MIAFVLEYFSEKKSTEVLMSNLSCTQLSIFTAAEKHMSITRSLGPKTLPFSRHTFAYTTLPMMYFVVAYFPITIHSPEFFVYYHFDNNLNH